ncbi:hypothetical protein Agub_g6009, partial [Astrephomene gubernaculifera]
YTLEELRSSCEYIRGLLDFTSGAAGTCTAYTDDGTSCGRDAPYTSYNVHTGSCRAALAARVLQAFLLPRAGAGREAAGVGGAVQLEVDGSNAAELLWLADVWCLAPLKAHVLAALRRNMC